MKTNVIFIINEYVGHTTEIARDRKKGLNSFGIDKLTYILYVIKELLIFKTFSFSLHSEEGTVKYENVWFFVVCNQPY